MVRRGRYAERWKSSSARMAHEVKTPPICENNVPQPKATWEGNGDVSQERYGM